MVKSSITHLSTENLKASSTRLGSDPGFVWMKVWCERCIRNEWQPSKRFFTISRNNHRKTLRDEANGLQILLICQIKKICMPGDITLFPWAFQWIGKIRRIGNNDIKECFRCKMTNILQLHFYPILPRRCRHISTSLFHSIRIYINRSYPALHRCAIIKEINPVPVPTSKILRAETTSTKLPIKLRPYQPSWHIYHDKQ